MTTTFREIAARALRTARARDEAGGMRAAWHLGVLRRAVAVATRGLAGCGLGMHDRRAFAADPFGTAEDRAVGSLYGWPQTGA